MERREFLIGAAAVAGLTRGTRAQAPVSPPAPVGAVGGPAKVSPDKLARIAIMTLNFGSILKLQGANPNPNQTLPIFDLPEMYADTYGVHNIEFQHSHIESTETSYLKELRARIEKVKSKMTQINLEFGGAQTISTADPAGRLQAIDLTKRWVEHSVILGLPRLMVNQGSPSQENKVYATQALTMMGDYARSKGVKISMETRGGGGGGGRGRAGAPGAAAAAPPAANPPWMLLKELIEGSNTYSNVDIGGVGAPNQEALHAALKGLMPTSSGSMHIKRSANWDVATAVKYLNNDLGYKGLYSIEINGHEGTRWAYDVILSAI